VIGLQSHDKARAHLGGIGVNKTPKNLEKKKQQRPIEEGNQELEKRLILLERHRDFLNLKITCF
jgi:hypothetical protein